MKGIKAQRVSLPPSFSSLLSLFFVDKMRSTSSFFSFFLFTLFLFSLVGAYDINTIVKALSLDYDVLVSIWDVHCGPLVIIVPSSTSPNAGDLDVQVAKQYFSLTN